MTDRDTVIAEVTEKLAEIGVMPDKKEEIRRFISERKHENDWKWLLVFALIFSMDEKDGKREE